MNQLGERIKKARKDLGMSQTELAKKVGLSYAQIGRYETKNTQPQTEVLKNIAEVLEVSIDYLMNGSKEEQATNKLSDKELINQFKAVEQMNEEDQYIIKQLIDAFIKKRHIQRLVS